MKVEELIIDGFKSYATRTVISGWDPQFNAITGLNGSGKSNILDAICFVLGISSMTTVRASNLQDLIYKRGQAGVTKASVTIVFDNSEISKSPIGFETYPKISVTRQIVLGGTSKYLINGHRAQQQTVLHLFQSVQLNINNPNFLIMQGKITKVLNMKPNEILSLIEEAAGTKMFEDRREKAEKTMAKKETKLVEIRNLLSEEIEPKLEKLRNEKRFFLEFQQTQTDLEKLSRIVVAHDFNIYSRKFNDHSSGLGLKQDELNVLNTTNEKLEREISTLEEDLVEIKKQQEKELKKDGKLKDLENKESELSNELVRLSTSNDIKKDNLKNESKKRDKLVKSISSLNDDSSSKKETYKQLEKDHQTANDDLIALKATFTKKEELLSTLSTGISSKGKDGGYMSQLKEVKEHVNNSNTLIQQSKLKIDHLNKDIQNDKPRLLQAQQENAVILKDIEAHKVKLANSEAKLSDLGFNPTHIKELRTREAELNKSIYNLSKDLEYLKRSVNNIEFNYSRPSPNFDPRSVKGVAAQLFSLDDNLSENALALEVCAGGRLYNVVVDNEVTGSQLLERGQLRKRVTIIPLNKISAYVLQDRAVHLAKELCPGKVELALNLIGYEKEVSRAMEFIFGSRLVCKDSETAKKVTFHPQIRARSITLEGDTYDPEGTLSGGSRRNNGSILINIQKYNRLNKQLDSLNSELEGVGYELDRYNQLGEKTKSLQNEVNLCEHELSLLKKKLETNPSAVLLKNNESNQKEIEELQQVITREKTTIIQLQQEIKTIEEDMKEFSTDKGSKLKKLDQEVKQLSQEIGAKEDVVNSKFEAFQALQMETEQISEDLTSTNKSIEESQRTISDLQEELKGIEQRAAQLSFTLETTRTELEEEKALLIGINEELTELKNAIDHKNKQCHDNKLKVQKLSHEIEKSSSITSNLKKHINQIIENNDWVTDNNILESIISQYPNINLDECHDRINQLEERFQGMKRKVNANIMSMIDNVEKKETSLRQMIKTIEKDKSKIEETITTLNEYKRQTLVKTWKKVSEDFGNIFADLLPGSFAKLVPPEGKDVTEGLEVKVMLGKVWKESLVELSGGQRSLIALSLIMALLQFKPAPMYILDEVDAALDLQHTQNIGHLIKTRFKGSQFIVVSLKEGMFTNANRVFRTRFQDGTSVVSVM